MIDTELPTGNAKTYSVSEIAGAVKRTLESQYSFVRVRGEVSKVTRQASGHIYFTIKDADASVDAVVWKGIAARVKAQPQVGDEIIVTGKVSAYAGSGSRYQIVAEEIELAGLGALLAQLQRLKAKLAEEGLFSPARKKPLPAFPRVIGVITSPTGAVIRDILHRIRDRYPTHIIVWPTIVQGPDAAAKVRAAIEGFNRFEPGGPIPRPDLLIVARGGGSVEDLWPFNDEALVRAVAASNIPLISAVGHETDTTLIDFASSIRAPTPTAAAELATPVRAEIEAILYDRAARLKRGLNARLETARNALKSAGRGLARPEDILGAHAQRVDRAGERLTAALRLNTARAHQRFSTVAGRAGQHAIRQTLGKLDERLKSRSERLTRALPAVYARAQTRLDQASQRLSPRLVRQVIVQMSERMQTRAQRLDRTLPNLTARQSERLKAAGNMLEILSYKNTLKRGFAVVHGPKGLIRDAADLKPGLKVEIELADGKTSARIEGSQGALF